MIATFDRNIMTACQRTDAYAKPQRIPMTNYHELSGTVLNEPVAFQVVEALALGEEPPTFTAEDDLTMPDIEGQQRRAKDELLRFNVRPIPAHPCNTTTMRFALTAALLLLVLRCES